MVAPSTEWSESVDEDEAAAARRIRPAAGGDPELGRREGRSGAGAAPQAGAGTWSRSWRSCPTSPSTRARDCSRVPATYTGFARLSNGGIKAQPDAVPDIRGLSLSFRGVQGEAALGGTTDRQDFVLINRPAFGFPDSQQFTAIVPALAEGKAAFFKAMLETFGPVKAPLEGARLAKDLLRPFSGFATEPFFSAAPIRWGPYAARVRLSPGAGGRSLTAGLDFGRDVADRLADGPVTYDLEAQFFVSEELTPIENGLVDWPSDVAAYLPVGRVTLPAQDPSSPEGQALAEQVEQDRFDPWAALAEHRPLGEIMRARKVAYFESQKHRDATGS